jgi:hypothetical protein
VLKAKDNRLLDVLAAIIDSLRSARAPFMIIGAWAVAVWGRPRATMDVDFMLMIEEGDLVHLGKMLTQERFCADEMWLESNPMLRGSQLRMVFHGVTVDLLLPRDSHDKQAFLRRKKKRVAGRYCWVVAPEDLILQKLKVARPRDFEDGLSVLERSRKVLDFRYLKQWAGRLGLAAELDYLLGE